MTAGTALRLPGFVIIGAAKAATTWVAHQLRSRPDVFLPDAEPHFFSSDYRRGARWYAARFAKAPLGALVGEKSADYLAHPEAPGRLAAMLPDARLVVQLRNPVERAYSDYCMLFRRGTVDGDIARHLSPDGPEQRFLNDGFYWRLLTRWRDHFRAEQIQILLYDDVRHDPAGTIDRVAGHVGVPRPIELVEPEVRQNDSQSPQLPLGLRRTLAPLKPAVAPFRSKWWFRSLHQSMARPVDYPPLTTDLRRKLADYYAADVAMLEQYIGRDLGAWRDNERRAA
jgi:hypothetical protein